MGHGSVDAEMLLTPLDKPRAQTVQTTTGIKATRVPRYKHRCPAFGTSRVIGAQPHTSAADLRHHHAGHRSLD